VIDDVGLAFDLGEQNVTVSPNPTNGIVLVSSDIDNPIIGFELFSSLGQIIIQRENMSEFEFEIDLGGVTGVYFIKLTHSDNTQIIFPIIKQ
jgi:hypothetical protein